MWPLFYTPGKNTLPNSKGYLGGARLCVTLCPVKFLCCTSAVLNSKRLSVIFSTQCYLYGTLSYLLCFPVTNDCYKVLLICAMRFGEVHW